MNSTLIIRADASVRIGIGHVMRCLALAQQWRHRGGRVIFAQAETVPALTARLQEEGIETSALAGSAGTADDAQETIALAQICGARCVVADGYAFGAAWQKQIKDAGLRLLVIDDYGHAEHYHADLVLNQNAGVDAALYARRDPKTRLLLGTRYALLRREFLASRPGAHVTPERAQKILVTLGGSDPDNVTARVVAALAPLADIEAVVVAGGGNPNLAAIRHAVEVAGPAIRLVVNATNMPELMAWADVAISAAGSTSWELAFMGLPSVLIVTAENQEGIPAALANAGVSINLGNHAVTTSADIMAAVRRLLDDAAVCSDMSTRGRQLVDGHGASRVAAALRNQLELTIVSDPDTWLNPSLGELKAEFEKDGHVVRWIHDPKQLETGDIAFFLSLSRIVPTAILHRSAHNLVVHGSALPLGRGWSPLTWQILEGMNDIPVTLIEAREPVDSGEVYAQELLHFHGHELIDELRAGLARTTLSLCRQFVSRYPFVSGESRPQVGAPSYYARRRPHDSRLDPDKTIREQFNLLRVADPDRYPAFFEYAGRRYEVRLTAMDPVRPASRHE